MTEFGNAKVARISSALAAALGLAGALYQAFETADLAGPRGVLAIAGTLAPTLAIFVAWWAPSRAVRIGMLVVAMLLELPALAVDGSALALLVESLVFTAVVATPTDRTLRPQRARPVSVVF